MNASRIHRIIASHKTAFFSFVALVLTLVVGDNADQILMGLFPITEATADRLVAWLRIALSVLTYLGFSPVRNPHQRPPEARTRAEDSPTFPTSEHAP
jgi:hypothetical protein